MAYIEKISLDTAFKHVEDEIEKVVRQFVLKVHSDADAEVRKGGAIATSEMVRNIRELVTREAGRITGVVGVGANVPYAIFRHEGTKPHFPPVEAIQKWVVQKGLVKLSTPSGKRPTKIKALYRTLFRGGTAGKRASDALKESYKIAFLIARKISKKGTTGLPFLKIAMNQNREFLFNKLAAIKV